MPGDHGLAEPLSFYQALLRSQALELLLDSCAKVPALRGELLKGKRPGVDMDAVPSALSRSLQCLVERLLLPGAVALWPTLLEALLVDEIGSKVSSCRSWARQALALVKRQWKYELIPSTLRCLDRKLGALLHSTPEPEVQTAELLRSKEGMSKGGIRAALQRTKLRTVEAEALRLKTRSELLCDACARLEVAQSSSPHELPEADQLLEAADVMLHSLDQGVKELNAEQENLQESLNELKNGLEKQMGEFKETLSSFSSKRVVLEEEKSALTLRLEEVQMQLNELQEASGAYQRRSRELENQLRENTKHFEEKIANAFCQQKRLADEKLRAVACKACAHTARDVVVDEEQRRSSELGAQLRRRRRELRRTLGRYLRKERLRLESLATAEGEGVEKAWQDAQEVLQRALPLCKGDGADRADPTHNAVPEQPSEEVEDLLQQPVPEDAISFFAQEFAKGQSCIDCGLPDADWASLSCGAYLCVDCAGRHRGLGVHLSFVRSTSMDHWSSQQLRRMQRGGTPRFRRFLATYPQLAAEPQSNESLARRYNSRAVAYYRQLLDLRCEGNAAAASQMGPAPAVQEGHLPAETPKLTTQDSSLEKGEDEEGEDAAIGSVEEELAGFEATYARLRGAEQEKD
ncbi:unnamed protein product [Cladocopium goreaui]|uniref:Probable ADP-ribosylation factor GTPase-activating protein AGD6 (ARF GAP AGD6) (Protein ARF-GAP DOMAIN 6) (AtAGD6) (Protein ZIGA2) n=1 Tax=Cladocopium goreaui TaxID=2562237 RepID=A0A9P1FVJ7_9DINO|nr:unnamed protein product [Cladocopium goreaui]